MSDSHTTQSPDETKKRKGNAYSNASAPIAKGAARSENKRFPLDYAERFRDADPEYWEQPLWLRIYLRCLYAIMGFVSTVYFFDSVAHAPEWMQIMLGCCVAVAVLMFRMAYPGGGTNVWRWIMEGMAEAASEQEAKGKRTSVSSAEIREALSNDGKNAWNKKQQEKRSKKKK